MSPKNVLRLWPVSILDANKDGPPNGRECVEVGLPLHM